MGQRTDRIFGAKPGIIGKSAPILAEITIWKSQVDTRLLVIEGVRLVIFLIILVVPALLSFIFPPIIIFYRDHPEHANFLPPLDLIQFILFFWVTLGTSYLAKRGHIFTRVRFELCRRYRIDRKNIKKSISA